MRFYLIQVYDIVVLARSLCYNGGMVKIVDHDKRKIEIAEATWRVILRDGLPGATVRSIAAEAGISLGALRHYFSAQEELLSFAMNLVKERAEARIRNGMQVTLPPREKALRLLLELLPVDDEKMAEMEVWFAFTFHRTHAQKPSGTDPDGILRLVRWVLDALDSQRNLLRPGINKELEAERLYALIDGLALHALLEPERIRPERMREVLSAHLDGLCRP